MLRKLGFVLIVGSLLVFGCKKEVDIETQTAVDITLAEKGFNSLLPAVNAIAYNEPALNRTDSNALSCAQYIIDTTGFPAIPATMIIDYGTGCLDKDGLYKAGQIHCTVYQRWSSDTAEMSITLNDYKVDQVMYEGEIQLIKYWNSFLYYEIDSGKCIDPSFTIYYNSERSVEQVSGRLTLSQDDDVFKTTGSSNGINRKGTKFTANIVKPLTKASTCKWISSGSIDVIPGDLSKRTLSYDKEDEDCDNKASITINDKTYDFELR